MPSKGTIQRETETGLITPKQRKQHNETNIGHICLKQWALLDLGK